MSAVPARGRRSSRPSGDDREAAILQTAERLLAERPIGDISVDDLARGAGISRPTFYFYFASKDAVLLTLLDRVVQEVESTIDELRDSFPADPAHGWRLAIGTFFEAFGSHRWVARAGHAALAPGSEFREVWLGLMRKWIDRTAALIIAERERGAAPNTIPADDLAVSLNLMNERAMLAALASEQPSVDHERVVDTLTHIWLTSIYGTPH
jgi:TetR/AcrR family transcriptional regulator, ethionamide resistance regulator